MGPVKVTQSPTTQDLVVSLVEKKVIAIGTSVGELPVRITSLARVYANDQEWIIKGYIITDKVEFPFDGTVRTDTNSGSLDGPTLRYCQLSNESIPPTNKLGATTALYFLP